MTQPLANTVTKVRLEGKPESIEKVHSMLRERTQKKINKRTDQPFSQIGDLDVDGFKKDGQEPYGTFVVTRNQIRGNHKNDVYELLRNVEVKANVTLKTEVIEYSREATEKIDRKPKEDTEEKGTEETPEN